MTPQPTSSCSQCGVIIPEGTPSGMCLKCHRPDGRASRAPVDDRAFEAETVLDPVSGGAAPDRCPPAKSIGPYRILHPLGEGGMGQVFAAEQDKPIRRRVAIKIIKPGMDSREILNRFEAERQALALMEHPNIARVLDAGATAEGRPYFAMELVEGMPVTLFCDQRTLSLRERLELFIKVCHAVQHAHQKGVIHRDLKPSNILVTTSEESATPVPKVIDFGIAKALGPGLTEQSLYTVAGQLLGTPQYMSPEQATLDATDIDTRSDLYALGVILYELLTGLTPLDAIELRKVGIEAMLHSIREGEVPRPSTRLGKLANKTQTGIAEARQLPLSKLSHFLRGDLDWVVMKGLEKERERRYQTASAFAVDIQRFLHNEPVSAAAPSAIYRFRKYARRNKIAFTIAALLVAGTGVSTWQAVRAHRIAKEKTTALAKAEAARIEAEDVSQLFIDIFKSPDPVLDGREIKVATLLDRAAEELGRNLADQPQRRATMRRILGETYLNLGLPADAVPLLEQSRDYHHSSAGPDAPPSIVLSRKLASAYIQAGQSDAAIAMAVDLYESSRDQFGEEAPQTLATKADLGTTYQEAGHRKMALPIQEEVLASCRETLGPGHEQTRMAILNLGHTYAMAGRMDEGIALTREGLSLSKKHLPEDHPETLVAELNLAAFALMSSDLDGALPLLEAAQENCSRVLGPWNIHTLRATNNLAAIYQRSGRAEEAKKMFRQNLNVRATYLPENHRVLLDTRLNLAAAYDSAGQKAEALEQREKLVADYQRAFTIKDQDTLFAMEHLAVSLTAAERLPEAIKLEEVVLRERRELLGNRHEDTLRAMEYLAGSYELAGRTLEAKLLLLEARGG